MHFEIDGFELLVGVRPSPYEEREPIFCKMPDRTPTIGYRAKEHAPSWCITCGGQFAKRCATQQCCSTDCEHERRSKGKW